MAKVFPYGGRARAPLDRVLHLGGPSAWVEGPAMLLLSLGAPNAFRGPDGLVVGAILYSPFVVVSP